MNVIDKLKWFEDNDEKLTKTKEQIEELYLKIDKVDDVKIMELANKMAEFTLKALDLNITTTLFLFAKNEPLKDECDKTMLLQRALGGMHLAMCEFRECDYFDEKDKLYNFLHIF